MAYRRLRTNINHHIIRGWPPAAASSFIQPVSIANEEIAHGSDDAPVTYLAHESLSRRRFRSRERDPSHHQNDDSQIHQNDDLQIHQNDDSQIRHEWKFRAKIMDELRSWRPCDFQSSAIDRLIYMLHMGFLSQRNTLLRRCHIK